MISYFDYICKSAQVNIQHPANQILLLYNKQMACVSHYVLACNIMIAAFIGWSYTIVPVNHVGMVHRLGKVHKINPGFNILNPLLDTVVPIHVGFDTDFTSQVKCVTEDNVVISFPRVYIDNDINCGYNSTCFVDIYTKYFLSDAKLKAKYSDKIVPEDGTIFKHMAESMSIACSKIKAHEAHKNWHKLYPHILKALRERVPTGVNVIAVRTELPEIPNLKFRTSITGKFYSWCYVKTSALFI